VPERLLYLNLVGVAGRRDTQGLSVSANVRTIRRVQRPGRQRQSQCLRLQEYFHKVLCGSYDQGCRFGTCYVLRRRETAVGSSWALVEEGRERAGGFLVGAVPIFEVGEGLWVVEESWRGIVKNRKIERNRGTWRREKLLRRNGSGDLINVDRRIGKIDGKDCKESKSDEKRCKIIKLQGNLKRLIESDTRRD